MVFLTVDLSAEDAVSWVHKGRGGHYCINVQTDQAPAPYTGRSQRFVNLRLTGDVADDVAAVTGALEQAFREAMPETVPAQETAGEPVPDLAPEPEAEVPLPESETPEEPQPAVPMARPLDEVIEEIVEPIAAEEPREVPPQSEWDGFVLGVALSLEEVLATAEVESMSNPGDPSGLVQYLAELAREAKDPEELRKQSGLLKEATSTLYDPRLLLAAARLALHAYGEREMALELVRLALEQEGRAPDIVWPALRILRRLDPGEFSARARDMTFDSPITRLSTLVSLIPEDMPGGGTRPDGTRLRAMLDWDEELNLIMPEVDKLGEADAHPSFASAGISLVGDLITWVHATDAEAGLGFQPSLHDSLDHLRFPPGWGMLGEARFWEWEEGHGSQRREKMVQARSTIYLRADDLFRRAIEARKSGVYVGIPYCRYLRRAKRIDEAAKLWNDLANREREERHQDLTVRKQWYAFLRSLTEDEDPKGEFRGEAESLRSELEALKTVAS